MKTNTVTRLDKKPFLSINPALEKELPPLTEEQYNELRKGIKRDGVLSPVCYWIAPNGKAEIVDGHHRHKIANELGIMYEAKELTFDSIEGVVYWMHRTNAGRRGGKADTVRMSQLLTIIKKQRGEQVTKTAIREEVAADTDTPLRTIYDRESKGKRSKPDIIAQITKLIARLTEEQKDAIRSLLK